MRLAAFYENHPRVLVFIDYIIRLDFHHNDLGNSVGWVLGLSGGSPSKNYGAKATDSGARGCCIRT